MFSSIASFDYVKVQFHLHNKILPQGERFKANDDIDFRKLLWHGTNVAVVTAILKSGLRIMPHSGGRVGRGIYFASENNKSAGYGEIYFYFVAFVYRMLNV